MTKTLKSAVAALELVLASQQKIESEYKAKVAELTAKRSKIESWLLDQQETMELTTAADIKDLSPYVFWYVQPKTDDSAVEAYRNLRDQVQEKNLEAKDNAEVLNEQKEKIGAWILSQLNARGQKSFNCGESGKAYKKLVTYANAADFDALIKWAGENNAADIVQKRVNAGFVTKYQETNGEFPPFVNVNQEYEVVVTK